LCDEGRELGRGEMLRQKMNGKLGFGNEEREIAIIDRGKLLWTQTH